MHGVNHQSINPTIAQNLEAFQESESMTDEDEVEAAHLLVHLQETHDVNAAIFISSSKEDSSTSRKSEEAGSFEHSLDELKKMAVNAVISSSLSIGYQKSLWTEERHKRFIELKQQKPKLPWKDLAKHFPGFTVQQCQKHWYQVVRPQLYQEGKLPNVKQIDPMDTGRSEKWTQEQHKRFIELKQQYPYLLWKDFAKHFPGFTRSQCQDHWYALKRKLIATGKSIGFSRPTESVTKEVNTAENPNPFINFSPVIPQKLAEVTIPSLSHAFPVQRISREEQKKLLDLSFYHYELAVNHFQEIQLTNLLLESIQQEAAECLANARMTYQVITQRLTIEENYIPILEQAEPLIKLCQTKTYYFETIYQHILSYQDQANQDRKEWYASQSEEFGNLYSAFLKENMDEVKFRHLISLKERDYHYEKLNNSFIYLQDVFKKYSPCFSLTYRKFIDNLFSSIAFQCDLLKDNNQLNWGPIVSLLQEILSRLQEIDGFFQSFFDFTSIYDSISIVETEINIIARLKNKISLQDFYEKQSALMTIQEEGKQAEDSIPFHEPSQTQEDVAILSKKDGRKKRSLWTEEEDKQFIEFYKQGLAWKEIAAQFPGKTWQQCRDYWRKRLRKRIEKNGNGQLFEIEQSKIREKKSLEKRKRTTKESEGDHPIKRARMQLSSSIPASSPPPQAVVPKAVVPTVDFTNGEVSKDLVEPESVSDLFPPFFGFDFPDNLENRFSATSSAEIPVHHNNQTMIQQENADELVENYLDFTLH